MNKLTFSVMNGLRTYCRTRNLRLLNKRCYIRGSSYRWEPPGMKTEPDIPEYKQLNIKLFSHDFPVLESFEKYVLGTANYFGLETDNWSVPPTKTDVCTLEFKKENVVESFMLLEYQRIVQVQNVPSTKLPILLDVLKTNCPAGLKIELAQHTEDDVEFRYVPNYEKIRLEKSVEELDERKKWL